MSFDNLLVEHDGSLAVITLNRPSVLNALNIQLLTELEQAVSAVGADPARKVLVITGADENAFAAGADIQELAALETADAARAHAQFGQRIFDGIDRLGKPVIAAVNGFALGGGCELALACTFRIASDTARFGQPEVKLGIMPGFGGTQRLARLVGRSRALDMIMTGRLVDAPEALAMGLVTRVVPRVELMPTVKAMANELAAWPAGALAAILDAVDAGLDTSLAAGQQHESQLFGDLLTTAQAREGTRAFLEKRAPRFTAS